MPNTTTQQAKHPTEQSAVEERAIPMPFDAWSDRRDPAIALDSYKRLNDTSVIAMMKSTTLVECISGGITDESGGT